MGTVELDMQVDDPAAQRFQTIEVTVNTGSTFPAVSRQFHQDLEVHVLRPIVSQIADGSQSPVDMGANVIRLQDQQSYTQVISAEPGEPALLGVVVLEQVLSAAGLIHGRPVPTHVLRL